MGNRRFHANPLKHTNRCVAGTRLLGRDEICHKGYGWQADLRQLRHSSLPSAGIVSCQTIRERTQCRVGWRNRMGVRFRETGKAEAGNSAAK